MSSNNGNGSHRFRPFVRITHNVKEVVRDQALGPLTLVVGEEASYKTSTADAIKLALTGLHPIGKNPSDLIKLAANPEAGITVRLDSTEGSAEWRLKIDPRSGKPQRPHPPQFEGALATLDDDERYCILPSLSVRELMASARGERKA